jgi:uncharacterized membrane protein
MRHGLLVVLALSWVAGCGSDLKQALALRAFGNEPFWNVSVIDAEGIVYSRLGEEDLAFPYVSRTGAGGVSDAWTWGPVPDASGEHRIEVRVWGEECSDTMSDLVHPMRAIVILDGEELSGCARRLDDPPSEAP